MDDLISRQGAINSPIKMIAQGLDWVPVYHLEQLPSAERRGRWIDGKRMRFDGTFHWFRQCSECLYERKDDNLEKDTNYCPNCGARMEA